jgi:formylglycine-generating enzyme required for sulfatase activity
MNTCTLTPVVAVLYAAFALASVCHAQTNVVLTLKMSTNGLTNWQTVQTIVTNMPASPQALYRMEIAVSNVTPPPSVPTNMALIPAGSFAMGSDANEGINEAPLHTVYVSAFYMDRYEVTKALWDEVRTWGLANGYTDLPIGGAKATNHPVSSISWFDVVKWSNARSQMEGLTPCYTLGGEVMKIGTSTPDCNFAASGYRLPTEAEWEKAARGGLSGKRFPWGDSITHSQANYSSEANPFIAYDLSPTRGYHPTYNDGVEPYSSPVGSFAPNGYGLHDMAGNIWEWCWDWSLPTYYASSPSSDPRGPASGLSRVVRGGGWYDTAHYARTTSRAIAYEPSYAFRLMGFRCARSSVP